MNDYGGLPVKDEKLAEQANEILAEAKKHGVEQDFFFTTTFKRYQTQLMILAELERVLSEDGVLVTKEYVKGRQNVYSHPAIQDYNRTTDSANKTVSTLMRIIAGLRKDKDGANVSRLEAFMKDDE